MLGESCDRCNRAEACGLQCVAQLKQCVLKCAVALDSDKNGACTAAVQLPQA